MKTDDLLVKITYFVGVESRQCQIRSLSSTRMKESVDQKVLNMAIDATVKIKS